MSRRVDLVVAVAFAGVGVGLVVIARGLRQGTLSDPLGVAGMPTAVGSFIAVACSVLALRQVLAWVRHAGDDAALAPLPEGSPDEPGHPGSAVRALGVAALLLGYVWLLPRLGYLLVTPPTVALALWSMQVRRPLTLATLAVGFTVVTWAFFDALLGVRLPAGTVTPW